MCMPEAKLGKIYMNNKSFIRGRGAAPIFCFTRAAPERRVNTLSPSPSAPPLPRERQKERPLGGGRAGG